MNFKVVEKFVSINGEGQKTGELAVFIRLASCNLQCIYCDTMWANEENVKYELLTKEEINEYITSTGVKNITLTGGEPLMAENVKDLILHILEDETLHLEIETNGSIPLANFADIENKRLSFTMDYKAESSGMEDFMLLSNFDYLQLKDTVKFVVGTKQDLEKAKKLIDEYNLLEKTKVFFSPIFNMIEMNEIVDFMIEKKLNKAKMQVQLHKVIWNPDERGV